MQRAARVVSDLGEHWGGSGMGRGKSYRGERFHALGFGQHISRRQPGADPMGQGDGKSHTPPGWVPANQRNDYRDPFARDNDPRKRPDRKRTRSED